MRVIRLYREPGIAIDIESIVSGLNGICKNLEFVSGESAFSIKDSVVSHPETYLGFAAKIRSETKSDFMAIFATSKRYNNDFFYEGFGSSTIVSFFGWERLTNLSLNNGFVFFIADLLALDIDDSYRHENDQIRECIYDFAWDKKGVDRGMRSALICPGCMQRINQKGLSSEKKKIFEDLQAILNDLGAASKWEKDIVEYWSSKSFFLRNSSRDQVFISYSHSDSEWLKRVRIQFAPLERNTSIQFWDDTRIVPGANWKEEIERALKSTKIAILLVSGEYLASDFIVNNELPPLFDAAEREGAVIMSVILRPCAFEMVPSLCKYQAVNSPSKTLEEMGRAEQERVLVKLAMDVNAVLSRL